MTEPTKESGLAWIGNLPESWDVATLKRTTYLKGRIGWQGLTTEEYLQNGDYLLVTGTDFERGRIQWSRCAYVDGERYEEDPYIQLKENDLLITKDGTIGKVAIVRGLPKPATLNSGVFVTRPLHGHYRQDFLYWVLVSDVFPEFITYSMVGTTINHLYQKTFERFAYPLPPLPEQERIAMYLDASCAAIDAAVAAKRRQVDILYDLQKVTIAKAVTRGLDESVQLKDSGLLELGQIPAHWRLTKLRYEISVRSGDFASDKFEDDGAYPVIGGNGEMGRAAAYNVDSEIVVVGRVGAYCGNTHFVKGRAWVSDNALIVESNHDKRFLTHLIRVLDFNSTAKKTAQPLVTGTQIKNTYVGMPPVAEQEEIVAFIENRTAQFASLRATLLNQITTLLTYRKSLIHECVTGQRRVTEADIKRVQAHG